MSLSLKFGPNGLRDLQILWEDSERALCRGRRRDAGGGLASVLIEFLVAEHSAPLALDRLAHEHGLKDELDAAWAARPIDLVREGSRNALLLEDPGGEPLERLLGEPMETGRFLRLAIDIATALGRAHQRGLVHKDVKPVNILVNCTDGGVRLTGFGVASRLPRQRQAPEPPEIIAGTLAYMAPEQTGRMNRPIDSRSDLYALGVTLYRMLTGCLPFSAADPMEWVHCHIARKPLAPAERLESIPTPISEIVLKLLAKPAEERHQTAAGLEHDLRRCLEQWEAHGRVEAFSLGEHDMPDRLVIPEKLYGREREVEALLAAFDRVGGGRQPELVLVSGYSGIGKSSVVNELHKAVVPRRGLFASGKFDQLKRHIPYATLVQALQSLVRPLLSGSDVELARWREAFQEALGLNGRLIVDLVPELKLVVGELSPVPELEPQQAQSRFQLTMRRFIGVFARPEQPLALFLDDLQWLDAATLDLIEDVLTQADVHDLILIGAYRDNEVDATHPLARKLAAIRSSGAKVNEIKLAPLQLEHVKQLVADALHCDPVLPVPLAQLVYARTDGNPFFAIQFLHAFADEGLLAFDPEAQRWKWDLQRIHSKGYADNVVDLMVGKLARLPSETQKALQELACLGAVADITTLSTVLETSETEVHSALEDALRAELIERLSSAYKFVHDRVQEAAYSSIPEDRRAATHLAIGRRLLAHTPPEKREEMIFDIVGQLDRGSGLIVSGDERNQLAELNLIAGKRAMASTAHHSALIYLVAGAALAQEDAWNSRRDLIFQLELHRAECEFLTGALAKSEERLADMSRRASNVLERAAVARLRINLYTAIDRPGQAIGVCLDYLRQEGIDWSPHPTEEEVRREYERIWSQVGSRGIEELIDLPLMGNPGWQATMDVLTPLLPAALFSDQRLFSLVVARMANVSLEHGHTDGSCLAYVWLGLLLGPSFNNYPAAFAFGQLGLSLLEKRGLNRFRARVLLDFSHVVNPWMQHARIGPGLVRRAFDAAYEAGDLTFAGYSCWNMVSALLATGAPLSEVQREAEKQLAFVLKLRFGLIIEVITGQLRLVLAMRGLTPSFSSFDGPDFDEAGFERRLDDDPAMAPAIGWFGVRKLQGRFLADDYRGALAAADRVERVLWTMPSHLEVAEYHLYAALAKAACYATALGHDQPRLLRAIGAHHKQIDSWAEHCRENFENRAALVGAELARIEGRELDAERLYEQAIHSARDNGFVHNEAIAYERASHFYRARGFNQIADLYLRNARHGYLRWGADGKVRQLEATYPQVRTEEAAPGPTSTIATPIGHLDLATVIKVSETVSSEMVLEKLTDTLLRTAIEQAGAERGLLIVEQRVAAEAVISGDSVLVQLCDEPISTVALPESILHYVVRTSESVILDDATAQPAFATDPYIRQRRARSILCLPLINQGRLNGVLYLENNLTPRAFLPARITVLKLLASQAAISLENSHLYRDLQEREAKIRRLVDANVVGIFIADFDGKILEANDAFLRIVGYDRGDLETGRISWTALTPPDWRERDARWLLEHKSTGLRPPIEKEYFRKDGSRVPIMLGSATIEAGGNQLVTFVVDLTERKAAEEALRESEERFRTLMQFSFEVYWETDAQHRFVRQEFSERLSDAPAADSELGKTRWEVPYLEPDEDAWRQHRETLDAHLPFRDFELVRPTPKGGKRYLSSSGLPVFDKAGRFIGHRGVARDITERKRASEALREVQMQLAHANRVATMGQLTASIAHEVNQPIAATVTNAEAALRFLSPPRPDLDEVRDALDRIVRDGNRAGAVVGRIRALIKGGERRNERVEINAAIREVVELTRSEAMKNGVMVQTDLGDDPPLVRGDRVELQQVILNLILNAIEAMSAISEGSRELLITRSTNESNDALVAVRDSGPGLTPAALEHLFKAFYTTKPGGMGMGLSICRSIIEAHGGQLRASANTPRGAVFQFTLPSAPPTTIP